MPTDVETLSKPTVPQQVAAVGQITLVEQARAVAEVQAAVVVAQQVPRDMKRAEWAMVDACGRLGLAQRAFYSVPQKGAGPRVGSSVHLARELARIFGNLQYGVHELRRDDAAGMSEIQAFAWDVETNVRSTRTFQVPHARMKTDRATKERTRDPLVDLNDVYLNNQNIGSRAVRECIFTVLPAWYRDKAEELCRQTLERGENGESIDDRIATMVRLFGEIGVRQQQIEDRVSKKRGQWGGGELAELAIVFQSIKKGEISADEEFPARRVTGADTGVPEPDPVTGELPMDEPPGWER